jgi:hypothetical protein
MNAELDRRLAPFRERQRAIHRGGLDHFEGMEAGFLEHFQLKDVAEAIGLIDEA